MKPARIKNYTGFSKKVVNVKIVLYTFVYVTWRVVSGKLKTKYYLRGLRRLLFFLESMHHNKYVKIRNRLKINLYVPGFPTKSFFTACNKMLEFEKRMPCVSALISITSACRYKCPHCYQKYDKGKDMDINILVDAVRKLQDKGISFFNIEGGEPFLVFDRLKAVCNAIDKRSEILINSTGDGMTKENLQELMKHKNILGIMFSLHTPSAKQLNEFMGVDNGWENLEKGIKLCHEVGMPVTFNTCILKESFYDGSFERILEMAKDFRGSILQLIKPKPAGGWLQTGIQEFTEKDYNHILEIVDRYNLENKYKEYTFISAMIREESETLFGCTAGAMDRFYINAKGDLQACEFLNLSFGNILTDDFDQIYEHMRTVFDKPANCLLCEKHAKQIYELKEQNNLKTLPLTPELSRQVYENWKRNGKPEFYKRLEEI